MNDSIQSIGLFIDGGYYAKVNENLEETSRLNIDLAALMKYIRDVVGRLSHTRAADSHITESHYFRGRYRVDEAANKHLLFDERRFEDSLIENDVIFHYKHLRSIQRGGNETVIEKGIDVWFALEAYELSTIRHFDYVLLITGDADHEMLIRKLKALKIYTILLTWDVARGETSTSRFLREEACTHIELSKEVALNPTLLGQLCRPVRTE